MKTLLSIALLLLITISACKKEKVHPAGKGFMGTWELRAQFGGIAGISDHYPPGNHHELTLNADSTFTYSESSVVVTHGTFSIIKNSLLYGTEKFDGLYYNHSEVGNVVRLNADTLKIGLDFDDGIESDYVRK